MSPIIYASSFVPGGFVILCLIAVLAFGLAAYAMYCKGDVRVEISRGKTKFELEGKEKRARD